MFDRELAKQLLRIAHDVDPPDFIGLGEFEDRPFGHPDGWKIVIFYDCGDLDYIDHFVSPTGEIIEVWPDEADPRFTDKREYDFNPLQCWRGVDDTERLLAAIDEG